MREEMVFGWNEEDYEDYEVDDRATLYYKVSEERHLVMGKILTNHSMTIDYMIELLDINLDELEEQIGFEVDMDCFYIEY